MSKFSLNLHLPYKNNELVFIKKNLLKTFKTFLDQKIDSKNKCYNIIEYCKYFYGKSIINNAEKAILIESVLHERYNENFNVSYKEISSEIEKNSIAIYESKLIEQHNIASNFNSQSYKRLIEISNFVIEKIKKKNLITKSEAAIFIVESTIKNNKETILVEYKSYLTDVLKKISSKNQVNYKEIICEI